VARIFLCHASEDKARVREVYHRLRAIDGFEPWLDEEDLLPGQEWAREIPKALQASDFILIFLSRISVAKRGYVQREMKLALDAWQELPEGAIHTIPVRLDDCDVPESFRRYHWADLFDPSGFDRIVRAIRAEVAKRPATQVTALEPVLTNSIGMEFVLIPAGTFMMGAPDSDAEAYDEEKPAHRVSIIQPFYLGKYPVTNRQYAAFLKREWRQEVPDKKFGWISREPPVNQSDHPVVGISWHEVRTYCDWLSRETGQRYRLPTEAEWEKAARGAAGWRYPWGDAWVDGRCHHSAKDTVPVSTYPEGASVYGCCHMLGNVQEWTSTLWGSDPNKNAFSYPYRADDGREDLDAEQRLPVVYRIHRGGSYRDERSTLRCSARGYASPTSKIGWRGFRVVLDM
jgi:formylglycine-generating enzyme required for sulfatase activity